MSLHIFHGDAVRKFVLACIWVMASCLLELANGGGFTCGITWWCVHLVFEPCVWVCERVCVCVRVCVCMCGCAWCMHVSMCACVHAWVCACVSVRTGDPYPCESSSQEASILLASYPGSRWACTRLASSIPWEQGIALLCSCLHAVFLIQLSSCSCFVIHENQWTGPWTYW